MVLRKGSLEMVKMEVRRITGKVRSLLCVRCNTALGSIKENVLVLEKMIPYIKEHNCEY